MSEWGFIFGAYAVAWTGLVAYAVRLWAVNRRAARRLAMTGGER